MPAAADARRVDVPTVLRATVTPLASIFGSGFLIIVPVLERTLGGLTVVGVVLVCAVAWLVGIAIRHNVGVVEPLAESGALDRTTKRVERLSDNLIIVAYVISIALYLRIMAEYIVRYLASGSDTAERALASVAVAVIMFVGVTRGFGGLDLLERLALAAVLVLTTALGGMFFLTDAGDLLGGGLDLPGVPGIGLGKTLLVLGGIVITVQGFETVRYLADEYDRPTRIWACRCSQLIAASIYIGFAAVATPLMGIGTPAGVDVDLLDITRRVAPLLVLPLVLCAVLSQFSAATADTVAATENLHTLYSPTMRGPRPYVLSGIAAIALAWTVPTLTIIAVASRAFAAYYSAQCVVALRTAEGASRRAGYGALALLMAAIALLARPAG